jgi:hypothetical protein
MEYQYHRRTRAHMWYFLACTHAKPFSERFGGETTFHVSAFGGPEPEPKAIHF